MSSVGTDMTRSVAGKHRRFAGSRLSKQMRIRPVVEVALAGWGLVDHRPDQDERGPGNLGRLHLIRGVGQRATEDLLVGPTYPVRDHNRSFGPVMGLECGD